MTDQELKDLVASFAIDRKESSAEFDRRIQGTDRIVRENAIAQKETDRLFKELDKKLDKLCDDIGGISNNMGHHAEQFFQDVFKRKLEFGMVKYDEMIPNLAHKSKKGKIEFDIALVNGESVALIEVKNRIHPDFVKILAEERIEKFREFFREFDDYDVYLGIAGFSFSDEVIDRASAYGIGIIKQVGEGVEIKADNLRVY
ncbi:hypothetical protein R83H12_00288 [Fibrobacteria bacterium R8-3-H12]